MISVDYEEKSNKFLIMCDHKDNSVVMGLPDRRFRKASGVWAAPALRRNIQYMDSHFTGAMFAPVAFAFFHSKKQDIEAPIKGETSFPSWLEFKKYKPMPHQIDGFNKWFPLNEAAIFFEQGLGKTYTSINLAAAWRITSQIDSVIVICPSSIKLVWEEELSEICPISAQFHSLTAGKYKAVDKFIENKTDFQWLIVGIEGLSQGGAFDCAKRFVLGRKCAIIVDESSGIKTPNKIRTDKVISLGKMTKKRLILSGTSITQGLEDLYTQFKFLNPQILGYDSFYSFRAQYCITISVEIAHDRYVQKIVGYKNEDEFISLIKPYTMRVEKKDVLLDLPDKIYSNRYVEMNPTQKRIYQEMEHEFFLEVGSESYEVKSALEQMLRLQQITGGHYPVEGEEKTTVEPIPGVNPKLAELANLMDETTDKMIVWCQFRPEISLIADFFDKNDIKYVEFHGGKSSDEKLSSVSKFRSDPDVKVFLATRAAARGLTLIQATTAVYYSQGYSLEDYEQSQDRNHRIGQKNACNYIHLVCNKTIDTKIIKALREKKSVADLIYSMVKGRD